MEKIDYSRKDVYEIDKGEYKDYEYVILYGGMYPCAYVQLKPEDKHYGIYNYNDIDIDIHGGIVFSDKIDDEYNEDYYLFKLGAEKGHWIGWDYGHSGDYSRDGFDYNKKWTTSEIVYDCTNVIDQLIDFKNNKIKIISSKIEHYPSGVAIQIKITSNYSVNSKWIILHEEDIEKIYAFRKEDLMSMIYEDIKNGYGFNKFSFITPYDETDYFEDVFNLYTLAIRLRNSDKKYY